MKRRDFFKYGLQSAVFLSAGVYYRGGLLAGQYDEVDILKAFVDTLIPEDTTPSASQLDLDKVLLDHAETVANYPRLIRLGCDWLHSQSMESKGNSFVDLDKQSRTDIAILADTSPDSTTQKRFFDRVKFDLFRFYYTDPASWAGMGFERPPQPYGYPDHEQPPGTESA